MFVTCPNEASSHVVMSKAPSSPLKENILIIDDNPDNLNLLTSFLSERGYKVRPAPDGQMALQFANVTPPDLILLDILMPEMDGYEICSQLKASPATKDIPVIFISALNEVFDKVKAFALGGVDYITRPFQVKEVLARVENQLRISRLSKQLLNQNIRLSVEIEERERAETALREKEQFLRGIYEGIEAAVSVVDVLEDGSFRYAGINPACERMTGFLSSEVSDKTPEELLTPEMAQMMSEHYRICVEAGESITYEECLVIKGKETWWIANLTPVRDSNERIYRLIGTCLDISDRKQAEIALAESERKYRNLVETSQDIIWSTDTQGQITFVNQAVKHIFGYSPEEMIGRSFADFTPPERLALERKVLQCLINRESIHQHESIRLAKDGRPIYLLCNALTLLDEQGQVVGATGTASDITALKQAEEAFRRSEARKREKARTLELTLKELKRTQAQLIQAEKMSSLGQMVAGIAHEINNPVSFIYGNLTPARRYFQDLLELIELYQQTYPDPSLEIQQRTSTIDLEFLVEDWKKLIDSMQTGAERISEIVRSLRNFSRLDEKELKPVDIHEGINNTLLILQHRLRAKGNSLEIEVIQDHGRLPLVTCYANQLNQVFMNLLNNAIDALETQPAPRTIAIRTSVVSERYSIGSSPEQRPTDFVVIRIADNGSGMNEEVLPKIFDPFFTTKAVGRGTGLGLSISYQIVVEKHKGYISCISAPGQGTEFIVKIPVTLA